MNKINNQSKDLFRFLKNQIQGVKRYWGILFVIATAIFLVLIIWAAYLRWVKGYVWADWTGLGIYTGSLSKEQRGKTLWDWFDLLIIPAILAIGAFWLNRTERAAEQKIMADRNQEAALQNYLDQMTSLLLNKEIPLRKSNLEDEVRVVARTRTLATLRILEPVRKALLLHFLLEAELISKSKQIIDLRGADLRGVHLAAADLRETDLSGVDLRESNLFKARLSKATLIGTDLSRANLCNAELVGVDLRMAILDCANLREANLTDADLRGGNLLGADLSRALLWNTNMYSVLMDRDDMAKAEQVRTGLDAGCWAPTRVTMNQLEKALSLEGARMPDGKVMHTDIKIVWDKETPGVSESDGSDAQLGDKESGTKRS